ncbi:hypothetical protein [Vibrio scophthalmi]|uniref:Uncharacterized protein n=1 Tax=Vibrio scophthalmi LMG 19158 TaxID=870967 RepID=F9RNP7_9VIBR|nr:hypothetical protein [Vibrio scophthalmi]EGU37072.1 hypothetical protein VIS19158_18176 [Vibrio scophthalmi LMG 19158]
MSSVVENQAKQAKAIMINGRYFYDFGVKGQVKTAYSIAGAQMFIDSCSLNAVLNKLDEKRKSYTVEQIELLEVRGEYSSKDLFKLRHRLSRLIKNSSEASTSDKYFKANTKFNLAELVMVTTMQWQCAERDCTKQGLSKIDWFFAVSGTERKEQVALQQRLFRYKSRNYPTLRERLRELENRAQAPLDYLPF